MIAKLMRLLERPALEELSEQPSAALHGARANLGAAEVIAALSQSPAVAALVAEREEQEAQERQSQLDEIIAAESVVAAEGAELDEQIATAQEHLVKAALAMRSAEREHADLVHQRIYGQWSESDRISRLRAQLASTADPRIDTFIACLAKENEAMTKVPHDIAITWQSKRLSSKKVEVTASSVPAIVARKRAILAAMRAAEDLKTIADFRTLPERIAAIEASIPKAVYPRTTSARHGPEAIANPKSREPKYMNLPGDFYEPDEVTNANA